MKDRPFEFRTVVVVSTLLGLVMALLIHFVVLSSGQFNWLQPLG